MPYILNALITKKSHPVVQSIRTISENSADVVVVRLIVPVEFAVVEVVVPSIAAIVLRTGPIVVGLLLSPVLCLLAPCAGRGTARYVSYGLPVGDPYHT